MPDAGGDGGVKGAVFSGIVAKDGDVTVGCANDRLPAGWIVHHLAGRIGIGLWIATDIGVGVRSLLIAQDSYYLKKSSGYLCSP